MAKVDLTVIKTVVTNDAKVKPWFGPQKPAMLCHFVASHPAVHAHYGCQFTTGGAVWVHSEYGDNGQLDPRLEDNDEQAIK